MSAAPGFAGSLKRHVLGQTLIRRNPFYYERAAPPAGSSRRRTCAGRRAWSRSSWRALCGWRARTDYGALVRGGAKLEDWPLLEKELLRHRLEAFTTGTNGSPRPPPPAAPAGVPLKLLRSLKASSSSRPASIG